jgi:hypothetical protein
MIGPPDLISTSGLRKPGRITPSLYVGFCQQRVRVVVRKNRVRCSNQKLKDPFGVLRPEFVHVTMLLILSSDGVFGTTIPHYA